MTQTPDTPAQEGDCQEAPKPCCKCEAYREIQIESAAEIARLKEIIAKAWKYADWVKDECKKVDKP